MTESHQLRQQRLKQQVDAKIAKAQQEKALLVLLTGNGKGKSTSGFGMITRATGYGQRCAVVQFIKGEWECGERNLLTQLGVEFHVMKTGFSWETQNKQADTEAAVAVWQECERLLADASYDVLLLDELTYMITLDYLPLERVLAALTNRPKNQSVIITGRAAHRALIELADTVSEVRNVKHAFDAGIKARKGIDW